MKIKKDNVEDVVELNDVQRGILFHYLSDHEDSLYNVQLVFRMNGVVDVAVLKEAIMSVQLQNEALRSIFSWEKISQPVQIILKQAELVFEAEDVSCLPASEVQGIVRDRCLLLRKERFDLQQCPFRVNLFKETAGGYVFVMTYHHILYDGWSTGIFFSELLTAYQRISEGEAAGANKKRPYVQVFRAMKEERDKKKEAEFWSGYLKGVSAMKPFSCSVNKPASGAEDGVRRLRYQLPLADLDRFCASLKVTKAAFIYTVYGLLLNKYNQESDPVFGATVSYRDPGIPGCGSVMGNFLNTVPFRIPVNKSMRMSELIKQVNSDVIRINDVARFSYFDQKQLLGLTAGQDLFNTLIAVENYPVDTSAVANYSYFGLDLLAFYENISFDLGIYVFLEEAAAIEFVFDQQRVNADHIKFFSESFIDLLQKIIEDPAQEVSKLSLFDTQQQKQIFDGLSTYQDWKESNVSVSKKQEWLWRAVNNGDHGTTSGAVVSVMMTLDHVDLPLLRESVFSLVNNNHLLKTVISQDNGQLVQLTSDNGAIALKELLQQLSGKDAAEQLHSLLWDGFEKDQPLFRATLISGQQKAQLVLAFHRAIADHHSAFLLGQELLISYEAALRGESVPAATKPLSYDAFSTWQNNEQARLYPLYFEYWLSELRDRIVPPELPLDNVRKAQITYRPGLIEFEFDATVRKRLAALAENWKIDLKYFLLAGFNILLSRYTGKQEILIGAVAHHRDNVLLNKLIGPLEDYFALSISVKPEIRFREYLLDLKKQYENGLAHSWLPIADLASALGNLVDKSRNELFDILFDYRELPEVAVADHGTLQMTASGYGTYDLSLLITQQGESLKAGFCYNSCYLKEETISSLAENFQTVIGAITQNPDTELLHIEVLSQTAKTDLLNILDNSHTNYPYELTIPGLFKKQVEKHPEKVAVSFGHLSLTYRELDEQSDSVAYRLSGLKIGRGAIIALLTDRSLYLVSVMLGILKAGGAYLPIDPDYPQERIDYMVNDSKAAAIIASSDLIERVSYAIPVLSLEDMLHTRQSARQSSPAIDPSGLCYVIYTSGTTGNPKGVMVEHRNVVRLLFNDSFQYDFSSSDIWTMFHSHCFDVSVWEIYGALLNGGRLIIIPKAIAKDTFAYWQILRSERVTILNQTPSAFYALQQQDLMEEVKLNVRYVIFAGEALSPVKLKEWRIKYPLVKLINMYGITETTVHSTYKEITDFEIDNNIGNIGRPLPTLSAYLLDNHGRIVPRGAIGELYIGGAGVTRGYLQKPELTAKVFLEDHHRKGERVYKSGDLARILVNGELEYIGRIDHQVQLRGFRVELGEVEMQLSRHPKVREVVVLPGGEDEDKYLVAYYISTDGASLEGLDVFLNSRLPEYMVPSFFMQLDAMPLTANGKLDRKALPIPGVSTGRVVVPPSSEVEFQLVAIWSEVLKLEEDSISIDASFFEMGGHSLNASMLVNKISRQFNIQVPLQAVLKNTTIRALALYLEESTGSGTQVIRKAAHKPFYATTYSQRQLYFLQELAPSSLAYNMPLIQKLDGPLDIDRIGQACQQLIDRHEILRTSFHVVDGVLCQKVHASVLFRPDHLETDVLQEAISTFQRPFDLSCAPLFRACVVGTAGNDIFLLMDIHHIINDGVSQQILINDLSALYNRTSLPVIDLSHKDYAEWLVNNVRQKEMAPQAQFWLDTFKAQPEPISLPLDFPRPAFKDDKGGYVDFYLQRQQLEALKYLAGKNNATLFMVLFSAYSILLSKLSGQEDLVIGVPVAGRRHSDIENMAGLFINTLPVRCRIDGRDHVAEALGACRELLLRCFQNQDYPYEQLIEELKLERELSRNPLFDVMFFYENFETTSLQLSGIRSLPYEYVPPVSKMNLTLIVKEFPDTMRVRIEYSLSLFDATTIHQIGTYFLNIIDQIVESGEKKVADIDILPVADHNRILTEFNKTTGFYQQDATIVSLFRAAAAKDPDAICVIYEDVLLTYRELDHRSEELAGRLFADEGIGKGDFVAVLLPRSEELLIVLLAILKTGAAYVPLDPAFPAERIRHILNDSQAKALIADYTSFEELDYKGIFIPAGSVSAGVKVPVPLQHIPDNNDPCYLIYTSGSTGKPKGVVVKHRNVVNFFAGMNERIDRTGHDCLLAVTSIAFDISVLELFWTICHGIEVVIYPSDQDLSGLDQYLKGENKSLDFSLFFFSSYNSAETEKYKLVLEASEYADRKGFHAIWTPERHFHEFGGLYPNPSVLSAALAVRTKDIRIRSGSVVSPLHDVVRIAEEWSVVDNLSGGRVAISFASGWNPDDFVLAPGSFKQRQEQMFRQIQDLRTLWKGQTLLRKNGLDQEVEIKIYPRPVQEELPVWVTSAGSPETFRKAGEAGANILTHFLGQDADTLAENIRIYRDARAKKGYDAGKVTLMIHTYIGDDIKEAEDTVRGPFIEYLKSSIGLSRTIFEKAGFRENDLTEELKDRILAGSFRRYYTEGALIGTVESCAGMINKLKQIDVDEIGCLIDFGIDQAKVMEGLSRLAILKDRHAFPKVKLNRKVTMMQSTPSFVNLLLSDQSSTRFLSSLQTILVGGEALPSALVTGLAKKNTGVKLYNMYGPTETTIWSCVEKIKFPIDKISIGKPILNTRVYVLDKYRKIVPPGVPGELFIGGDGVALGYWNKPQLTSERFVDNPYQGGGKLYNTGDIVKWMRDGRLEYIGRKDFQVKIRGFRIELQEIEICLLDIEGVDKAVVVVRTGDDPGQPILVAYVIAEGIAESVIRTELSHRLPYYMIPSAIVFLRSFPLTANGKLDRMALPAPVPVEIKAITAAETPAEILLTEVWAKVLGLPAVGITDNFFSIGGDSIKSIQIIARLRTLGYELSVKDIFTSQHIRELAPRLRSLTAIDQSEITGPFLLTPIQQWFWQGPVINKNHYNQAVLLSFHEPLDPETVTAIFRKIQSHHDALRIVFPNKGTIAETKDSSLPIVVEVQDLRGMPDSLLRLSQLCGRFQADIDIVKGPLFKTGLFHLDTHSCLLIVVHHLVIDGISWRILLDDIDTLYKQIRRNEALQLPLKTDSYHSWSQQLRKYIQTKEFLKAADYWRDIANIQQLTVLRDHVNGKGSRSSSETISFQLDEEYSRKLMTETAKAYGTQINDILIAALALAIQNQYGEGDILMEIEGHGREEIIAGSNYHRTIGWFTSIFPVLLSIRSADMVGMIKYVKELLHAIPNKGVDYIITEYTATEMNGTPVERKRPQLFFNYLGQFDPDLTGKAFSADYEAAGEVVSSIEELEQDWDILGIVKKGRLQIRLTYSREQYEPERMTELLEAYRLMLENIIRHCSSLHHTELTPSDLTFSKLSVTQLDRLQHRYEIGDIALLSPLQNAILFHTSAAAGSPFYFMQISYRITGSLDIHTLEKSFNDLLGRHAVLRTMFLFKGFDQPVQLFLKARKPEFEYTDLREKERPQDSVDSFKVRDRIRHFDLEKDCLIRLSVFQVKEQEYELVWSYHHIVMDGWSAGIVLEDFKKIYAANRRKQIPDLLPIRSYTGYLKWLQEYDGKTAKDFWRIYLQDYEGLTGLPQKEQGEMAELSDTRTSTSFVIDGDRLQLLKGLSVKCGVTINTILQVGWGVLLGKYHGRTDVVFGAVVSGRPSQVEGIETMVGLFINTIPVRVRYAGSASVNQVLKLQQGLSIESEPYHYCQLSELEEAAGIGRGFFDHVMIFENFPVSETVEGSIQVDENGAGEKYAISDLRVFDQNDYNFYIIIIPGAVLTIRFDYSPDKYDREMVADTADRFLSILDQFIANDATPVSKIQLTSLSEREMILAELSAGVSLSYPASDTVLSIFRTQVTEHGSAVAIRSGEKEISYSALDKLSDAMARNILNRIPVKKNGVVALYFEPSIDLIISMLGIIKAGFAYVCLSSNVPAERNRYMLSDCQAEALILQDALQGANELMYGQYRSIVFDINDLETESGVSSIIVLPQDLLYIIYTSGTTGQPKGVAVDHRGIVNMTHFHKTLYDVRPGTLVSQVANVIFDASAFEIWPSLLEGCCLHISPAAIRLDPAAMKDWLIASRIMISYQPTIVAQYLLKSAWPADGDLRILNIAGDKLNYVQGKQMPFRIFNLYGPTEDSIWTTWKEIPYAQMEEYYSIGRPIANKHVYIVDADLNLQPVGFRGELCISGDGLARGYVNDNRMTVAKFTGNPFEDGQKLYRTGDFGRWRKNGDIEFLGREDSQVKIRGFRVELSEVDRHFSSHTDVEHVVVIPELLNGETSIIAYYTSTRDIPGSELREYMLQRLPSYMVPACFMQLPVIPMTATGKLDRKALPAPVYKEEAVFAGPGNDTERTMVKIWSAVLSVEEEQVSVDKSFFQLGGHSLKMVEMVNKVNDHFGLNISLNDAFEKDTIHLLCEYVIIIKQPAQSAESDNYTVEIAL